MKPRVTLTFLVALLALAAANLSPWAAQPGPVSAAYPGPPRQEATAPRGEGQPMTPLEKVLKPDGMIDLKSGFTGSMDPTGWEMVSEPGAPPRFVKDDRAQEPTRAQEQGRPSA